MKKKIVCNTFGPNIQNGYSQYYFVAEWVNLRNLDEGAPEPFGRASDSADHVTPYAYCTT